jgi:hypothetical protein
VETGHVILQVIAVAAEDKLRWRSSSAVGSPLGAVAESVVVERSWILNYVIFHTRICLCLVRNIQLLIGIFVVIGQ